MMFWWGNGMGGWGWTLMTISTVVFWALVIAGIVALVRFSARGGQARSAPSVPSVPRPTPEQMLAERFARGEIDEPEYRQRLDVLSTTARTPADRP
ncbi:SHOCT domain-containing protein [Pseudonocardia acidicola]|uniref:SHOCT domain-containing protein n=1 Tax=Pseudonocardia acidicola TaxID=2724939 RepID=A0ABX1S889_9PSEU|nr:SHOCT domain-containing protein [Pseudonocardia acidicola]NMH97766.1 SHOCT domain-containing protein [Pseudonocardia acidicola]